jgi:phospholipase C
MVISTSVRNALPATASLRRAATEAGVPFPVHVRSWIGALPPGRILRKIWSFDLLQRKFDEVLNEPKPPLVQLRLHGERRGEGKAQVFKRDSLDPSRYDEDDPLYEHGLGQLEIDLPGPFDPDYRFVDLRTDVLDVRITQREPSLVIDAFVGFAPGDGKLDINNFPDFDFDGLNARLRLEFGRVGSLVDPLVWVDDVLTALAATRVIAQGSSQFQAVTGFRGKGFSVFAATQQQAMSLLRRQLITQFVVPDASVDVTGVPDGVVATHIEELIVDEIFAALSSSEETSLRARLARAATTWLTGGLFHVLDVTADGAAMSINCIVPRGQPLPFPESPRQPLDPGLLANIDHIVVLMMENRSFDHMLGYLRKHGRRGDIDGLVGGEKNNYKGLDYQSFALAGTVFHPNPCHRHDCVINQINGGRMNGFVINFAERAKQEGVDPGAIMGYHTAANVPVYDTLAREFLVCQRWFAAHPGPTLPNRFYTLTGRLNRDSEGGWQFDNPHGDDFVPASTKTIFDHLSAQAVPWRFYEQGGYCSLRLFETYTSDIAHIVDLDDPVNGFFACARDGRLSAVSFIDPNFTEVTDDGDNDDQPPTDIAAGQNLIGRVAQALINGPLWSKTLLLVVYDEHGGFFDHVPPPNAPAVSGIDRYGVRVPALVVSPWVARGGVSSEVFDHTSVLETIARRFLSSHPPDMGERMVAAKDLSTVLQPTARHDLPHIPVPPPPARRGAPAGSVKVANDIDPHDLAYILRSVRSRYPVPMRKAM